jgi:hypothetical protein
MTFRTIGKPRICTSYGLLFLLLCVPLFIYLFYRTDRTVATHLAGQFLGVARFEELRHTVRAQLPLPHFTIFSLPELIWVFVFTRLSRNLYFNLGRFMLACVWVPLLFSLGLEAAQGLDWAHGRFDWWDCLAVLLGWLAGRWTGTKTVSLPHVNHRFLPLNLESSAFLLCFCSVLLAHVY